jgi:hypothetical protein
MFDRYLDGLATWAPEEPTIYEGIGAQLAQKGMWGAFARIRSDPV